MAKRNHVKEACKAHTDLNIFAAVVALMETSLLSSDSHPDEARIVALCQRAQAKCLARYDREMALALPNDDRPTPGERQ